MEGYSCTVLGTVSATLGQASASVSSLCQCKQKICQLTVVPVCYIKQADISYLNSNFFPLNNVVCKSIYWGSAALADF